MYNAWGFFQREIDFDTQLEFYVPAQHSPIPILQGSIIIIAIVVSLQLLCALLTLIYKFRLSSVRTKKQILNLIFAAISILSMSLLNILVDMQFLGNDTYLFILTNVTFIAVTIVILTALNQEYTESNVGFKIMSFNLTLLFLVLSLIANILFSRYKSDFIIDLDREKDFVKNQIEKGTLYPIVYQADIVLNLEDSFFNINKFQKPLSSFTNLNSRIPTYTTYKLERAFPGTNGIFWMGDFSVKNMHFLIGISYKEYRRKIHSIVIWLILTLIATLILVSLLYPILHKANIVNPLNRLLEGIHRMQNGDLNTKIEITTFDEIGIITASFNQMISQVRDSRQNLELLIQERTEELHQKLKELENAQSQLLLAERMSTLGRIAAGVAHEINNPLASIKASSNFLRDHTNFFYETDSETEEENIIHKIVFGNHESPSLASHSKLKMKRELASILKSFGFSDAEEVSDSCFDMGITVIAEDYRDFFSSSKTRNLFLNALEQKQILFHLKIIDSAVDRASKIVFALKQYSYSGPKENKVLFNLKQGIDEVLQMYANVWRKGTQIDVNVDENIKIYGYPDELVQVWTNLIYNSLQATAKINGMVEIYSRTKGNWISVMIKDNGHGIPTENLSFIFEPFFTTKELGMGTGLGLPIVKKIIESHGGEINVESEPGRTIFEVILPIPKS